MTSYETYEYDVLVIGSGGAGLRAAISAKESGANVAVVCKSLLGKAHTVMAEGGIAAALGNVDSEDNWKVHFKDTMFGGKYVNDWRMVKIHAQESPEVVKELERWGAVFDRTPKGEILQRPFGGHTYQRLCHVGDRTGLEMIRTLQDKIVNLGVDVYMECMITHLLVEDGVTNGAFGIWKNTGEFVLFKAKSIILATGGIGRIWKITSNSWDCTADGHALSYLAGALLKDMEFVQFHPTGMMWPLGVKGVLVTEAVRGDGGILRNNLGERFMARYDPKRLDLSTRDVVARAIYNEVKEGRGTPHGGVYLDISHKSAAYIKKRLPSMYDQFLEFANVDITREAMEVGPTCHYIMGGVMVDPETQASSIKGLYAAGEVAAGLHGGNRLGGNSLSDLVVFGKRAGLAAAEYSKKIKGFFDLDEIKIKECEKELTQSFTSTGREVPSLLHRNLQDVMEEGVGIIRNENGLSGALRKIAKLKERYKDIHVSGSREYNFGWHLCISLKFMLNIAEIATKAALERKESRSAHAREDYPKQESEWGKKSVIVKYSDGGVCINTQVLEPIPQDLAELLKDTVSTND